MKLCRDCGRPVTTGGAAARKNTRCLICRTAQLMRGWRYTPDPYAVTLYREDEARWASRPAETKQ